MRFGVLIPMAMVDPESIVQTARRGEELGFGYVSVPDHTLVPRNIESRYPYDESGALPEGAGNAMDELALLSFLAATTTSIRLLTSVLILPIRNPLVMANQLATIDVLSGGRLTAGCGIGWMREEFEATGAPAFEDRAGISAEYIRAFRELWSSADPSFDGEYVRFSNIVFEPKPVQRPSIPIWIGGESPAALRRAGRLADAWYPISANPRHPIDTLERFTAARDEVRRHAREAEREPESVDMALCATWDSTAHNGPEGKRLMFTGPAADVAADLEQWEAAGLRALILRLGVTDADATAERLAEFAETVMPLR